MVVLVAWASTWRAFPALYLLAGRGRHFHRAAERLDNLLSALYSFPGGYLAAVRDETSLIIFN